MSGGNVTVTPTPTASDPVLAEIVRRLVAACQPERVLPFGSIARAVRGLGVPRYILVSTVSSFRRQPYLK